MRILIIIIIVIILALSLFIVFNYTKKVENNINDKKEIENESLEDPTLSPDIIIPDNKINTSNFDPSKEIIKKEQLIGKWISESQDFVGDIYTLEGITLIFDDNNYKKLSSENTVEGSYTLVKNVIMFDNKKLFVNIKNGKLILIYPEYPKAEIYIRAE